MRIQSLRILAWNARGRVALAVASRGREPAAKAMLPIAKHSAKRILRERTAWGAPLAALKRKVAAHIAGRQLPTPVV